MFLGGATATATPYAECAAPRVPNAYVACECVCLFQHVTENVQLLGVVVWCVYLHFKGARTPKEHQHTYWRSKHRTRRPNANTRRIDDVADGRPCRRRKRTMRTVSMLHDD